MVTLSAERMDMATKSAMLSVPHRVALLCLRRVR